MVSFTYNGRLWEVHGVDSLPDGKVAEADLELKRINILDSAYTLDVFIHELVHVAVHCLYVGQSDLTFDQAEELFAELFAYEGETILRTAKKLLKCKQQAFDKGSI